MKRRYVDRSRIETTQRCRRARWHEYESGEQGRGIVPSRKSIHLVLGGAVHVGLEVLLRESQQQLSACDERAISEAFDAMVLSGNARAIEDHAVAAALADLAASTTSGVELDTQEQGATQSANLLDSVHSNVGAGSNGDSRRPPMEESPIVITFDEADYAAFSQLGGGTGSGTNLSGSGYLTAQATATTAATVEDFATPRYTDTPEQRTSEEDARLAEIQVKVSEDTTGIDSYLREELAALVEGIVRAYARRRLRPLLTDYEVLEVEREGSWKLGDVPDALTELWFASRADALLRERSTSYLYVMSFKTTGSWDRRRAMDAEVDMQGLSEAVDVDRRLLDWWQQVQSVEALPVEHRHLAKTDVIEPAIWKFLAGCAEPPRVLGVRYEYMLKGPRLQDKYDPDLPNRYVQNSPLIRAYKFEGVTSDERKWAHSYTVHDLSGKARNLDWRSWKKAPVWRYLPIADWIDMLDRSEIQMDAYTAEGYPYDVLAEQFIPPITVYRNEDDMRDMLEQIEASETQVAIDAAAVHAVANDPIRYRSELNQRFPQSRHACTYPGVCAYRRICYSGAGTELREHPEQSELYQVRIPNHPIEGEQ